MHPILNSWSRIAAWLAAWVLFGIMFAPVAGIAGRMTVVESIAVTVPMVLALAVVCLTPLFVCRALPLRSTAPGKLATAHIGAGFWLAALVMIAGRLSAAEMDGWFPGIGPRFTAAMPVLALIVVTVYMLAVAAHYAYLEVETSRRAELLTREAELKALKSQVNPHFLFNSLNSISALTTVDPTRARDMCVRLAGFLRISLRLGERTAVAFSEELELMKMYLDVEQVRFGDRLRLTMNLDPACSPCEVPALLIQPLVENAIKHGIAMMAEGGDITIAAHCEGDVLRFTIENPFDPDAPHQIRNGIGLRNVRDRLEARYGGKAEMKVDAGECRYRVSITLPIRKAA